MSVKFQENITTRTTQAVKPEHLTHELAHKVGERLTGGDTAQGYLAVCGQFQGIACLYWKLMESMIIGLLEAAANQPAAHQDAHLWCSLWSPGIRGLVARS